MRVYKTQYLLSRSAESGVKEKQWLQNSVIGPEKAVWLALLRQCVKAVWWDWWGHVIVAVQAASVSVRQFHGLSGWKEWVLFFTLGSDAWGLCLMLLFSSGNPGWQSSYHKARCQLSQQTGEGFGRTCPCHDSGLKALELTTFNSSPGRRKCSPSACLKWWESLTCFVNIIQVLVKS